MEILNSGQDTSIAVIDRVSARTRKRIAFGYRKLFSLSMATFVVVGMVEYKHRSDRYQRFTRLALKSQAKLCATEDR